MNRRIEHSKTCVDITSIKLFDKRIKHFTEQYIGLNTLKTENFNDLTQQQN